MSRVVLVFENEKNRSRIEDMLASDGIEVRLACKSGAEAIRAVHNMGSGLIISSYKLPDMTSSMLAQNLAGLGILLVIGTAAQLDMCDGEDLFKLPTPLSRADLISSANMLLQLEERVHKKVLPARPDDDKQIIESAKIYLMERNLMTEVQAHRFIQKRSMDSGSKMIDTAKQILKITT